MNNDQTKTIVPFAERFWAKVDRSSSFGCWNWMASKTRGYGQFMMKKEFGRPIVATRVSWFLAFGVWLPSDVFARHECDNPSCVNPLHLLPGLAVNNASDMKSRSRQARGETHSQAKLLADDVRAIRSMIADGVSDDEIGTLYGVGRRCIGKIRTGRRWGWMN